MFLYKLKKHPIITILFVAFLVRFILFFIFSDLKQINLTDDVFYKKMSKQLFYNSSYVDLYTKLPTAFYSPGYPYFVSFLYKLFGNVDIKIAKVANIFLSTILVYLSYLLAKKLTSEKIGNISAIIMTFFPSQIFWSITIMSEPLFGVLGLLCIISLYSNINKKYFIAGFLFSLLLLVRSQSIILFPAIFYIIYKKNSLRMCIKNLSIFTLTSIIFISPWIIRNHITFNKFFLTSNSGLVLLMAVYPNADGGYKSPDEFNYLVNIPQNANEGEKNDIYSKAAYKIITENPYHVISLAPYKFSTFLRSDIDALKNAQFTISEDFRNAITSLLKLKKNKNLSYKKITAILITEIYYLAVFSLFIIGCFFCYKNNKDVVIISLIILISFSLFHSFHLAIERYHFFIIPFLSIIASITISNFIDYYYNENNKKISS